MSELNPTDLEIIKDILGLDDDDPIFGRRDEVNNDPISYHNTFNSKLVQRSPRSPSAGPSSLSKHSSLPRPQNKNYGPLTKCTSICLGGPDLPVGMTTETSGPHFCSSLSCISCDFNVARYPNCRWKKSTDYLFLRNNFPDTVEQNLVRAPGWCAYCCQCTFCEEQTLRKLPAYSSNWVCRGH